MLNSKREIERKKERRRRRERGGSEVKRFKVYEVLTNTGERAYTLHVEEKSALTIDKRGGGDREGGESNERKKKQRKAKQQSKQEKEGNTVQSR